jgi:hypothetical protein
MTLVLVESPTVMKNLRTCEVAIGKKPVWVNLIFQPLAVISLPAVTTSMPLSTEEGS